MTTHEVMTLQALLEKGSDSDLLREMIACAAGCPMALDVEGVTDAAHAGADQQAQRLPRTFVGDPRGPGRAESLFLKSRVVSRCGTLIGS